MISMVMPAYNEESLIQQHLELASPYLDEIIIVDGSPQGPSTDKTQEIATSFENVKVIEGTFELSDWEGGWDKKAQLGAGVEASSGDIILITSVDIVYDDYQRLIESVNSIPKAKMFYSPLIEFFIDTNHLRLNPEGDFPRPFIGYPIIRKDVLDLDYPTLFNPFKIDLPDKVYLHDILKYHYGWVRPFDIQMRRHIRNVKSGLWGEYGDSILFGEEKNIETWAIAHVLTYKKEICFCYTGNSQHPINSVEFSPLQGLEEVLQNFREKYGVDYYDSIG